MKIGSFIIGCFVLVIVSAGKCLLGQTCSLHQKESIWKYKRFPSFPESDIITDISIFKVKDTVLYNGDTLNVTVRDSGGGYDTTYSLRYIIGANSTKKPYCSYWDFLPCDSLTPPCRTLLTDRIHGSFTPLASLPLKCEINMPFHAETLCCCANYSETCNSSPISGGDICLPNYREYYAQGVGLLLYWDHWGFKTVKLTEYNGLSFSRSWYDSLSSAAFPPSQYVRGVGFNEQNKARSAAIQRQLVSIKGKIVLTIWDSNKKKRFTMNGRSLELGMRNDLRGTNLQKH